MGNRIFYAVQQAGIRSASETTSDSPFTLIHGLQSVGINTSFNSSPISDMGYTVPHTILDDSYEVQVSFKKVLDGYPLLITLASKDSVSPDLVDRIMTRCSVGLSTFNEVAVSYAMGTPLSILQCSGMYISSFNFTFNTQGNFEESLTLVGNNKLWKDAWKVVNPTDITIAAGLNFSGGFTNKDSPNTTGAGGHVARRQHMIFTVTSGVNTTRIPSNILGVDPYGHPTGTHVSSISVSANIARDNIPSLGSKTPHYRLPNWPLEITTEITTVTTSGDGVSVTEGGILNYTAQYDRGMLSNHTIGISLTEGTRISLGSENRLVSINYQGGDAGGGNVTTAYTYRTYNNCVILHQNDTNISGVSWWTNRTAWMVPELRYR